MKFKVGDIANGVETSELIIEARNYVEALETVVADANLYCKGENETSEAHISRLWERLNNFPM